MSGPQECQTELSPEDLRPFLLFPVFSPHLYINDVEIEESVEGSDDEILFAGFLEDLFESEIDHGVDVLENCW